MIGKEVVADQYDLIIIGGGILGASLLWEATSRGVRALLLEKEDFGFSTFSDHLRMIPAGLPSLNFTTIVGYCDERKNLASVAPHFVIPTPCLEPIIFNKLKSKWLKLLQLKFYDLLTWDRNRCIDPALGFGSSHVLNRSMLETVLAGIGPEYGGAVGWYDAQIYQPERLIIALILSAKAKGGQALNYASVTGLEHDKDSIAGVNVFHEISHSQNFVKAEIIVNCSVEDDGDMTGLLSDWQLSPPTYANVINMIADRKIADYAIAIDTQYIDSNMGIFFIEPWQGGSVIGTWYLDESHSAGDTTFSAEIIDRKLQQVARHLPFLSLDHHDISRVCYGRLPIQNNSKRRIMVKPTITHAKQRGGPAGLYFVQDIKLTSSRQTAKKAIDEIARECHWEIEPSLTAKTPIYGGALDSVEVFLQQRRDEYAGRYNEDTLLRLFRNYGSAMDSVLKLADQQPDWSGPIPGVENSLTAELHFIIKNEMVENLSDLMMRRTDIGAVHYPDQETLEYCIAIMAEYKSWDDADKLMQAQALSNYYSPWRKRQITQE